LISIIKAMVRWSFSVRRERRVRVCWRSRHSQTAGS
jgi:hypothetical protein